MEGNAHWSLFHEKLEASSAILIVYIPVIRGAAFSVTQLTCHHKPYNSMLIPRRHTEQKEVLTFFKNWSTVGHQASFPGVLDGKESACSVEDPGLIPGSGRSPREGNGYPLQYSCWRIPWTEEPGRPQFMGLQRVEHGWVTCTYVCAHACARTHTHTHTHTHTQRNQLLQGLGSLPNELHETIHRYKMADYSPKGELLQRNLYLCGNQSLRQKEQKLKESSLVCDRQREGCLPSHCIWNNPFRLLLPSRPPNVCGWLLWQTCIFLTVRMNLQLSNRWISPGPT